VSLKKYSVGIALFCIFLIIAISSYIFYIQQGIIKVQTIPMDITVIDSGRKMGFNIDTDALHFGTANQGAVVGKTIILNNTGDFPVVIELDTKGPMKYWMEYKKNEFLLDAYSNNTVELRAHVPTGATVKTYNSTLYVYYKEI